MTPEERTRLRELAGKASDPGGMWYRPAWLRDVCDAEAVGFIVAATPAVVLALLDGVARLEGERDELLQRLS